ETLRRWQGRLRDPRHRMARGLRLLALRCRLASTGIRSDRDMDCPSSGHPTPAAARFCGSWAAPLTGSSRCPSCGASNPPGQRFCNACAQPLANGDPTPLAGDPALAADPRSHPPEHLAEKIRANRGALEGERKQATVLFADGMGSMELAEQSDPEEWRRLMDR